MDSLKQAAGGSDLFSQLFLAITALLLVVFVITSYESLSGGELATARKETVLLKDTTSSQQFLDQDAGAGSQMANSKNEASGIEFSYSAYLMINPETFDQTPQVSSTLKHVFHRGFKNAFPIMGPGVFVESGTNTLRIFMNSVSKWNNDVSIPNVPVGKWFHIVIILKGQYMDVYINGNVTQRHKFSDVPRLNVGNVYVMWPITFPVDTNASSDSIGKFKISGAMNGMVSRLQYYSYALTYSQIDGLMNQGPSKVIMNKSFSELPPYFHDDWWVTRY
jgi:hypothetical protein